jgi:hypothetical protein
VQSLPEDLRVPIDRVTKAFLGGAAGLKSFADPDRLYTPITEPWQSQVDGTDACGYWGTGHLAFVQTVSTYESADGLGWVPVLLILRRQQNQWALLAASADPLSNDEFVKQLPKVVSRIEKPWSLENQPLPAKMLTLVGVKNPSSPHKQIREFRWQPSGSNDLVAEVAEFARNGDARLFVKFWLPSHPRSAEIPAEKLPFTGGEWRWRVWSISDSGTVAFSHSISFLY